MPNCAPPVGRGGATAGITRSWIIPPSYRAESRQSTVGGVRGRGDRVIVHAGNDRREDVGLEAARVEQVILEQLARLVAFRERAHRREGVRPFRQLTERELERPGQARDVFAIAHPLLVLFSGRVAVRSGGPGAQRRGGGGARQQRQLRSWCSNVVSSIVHWNSPWLRLCSGFRRE